MNKEQSYKAKYDELWEYVTGTMSLIVPRDNLGNKPEWEDLSEELRQVWRETFDRENQNRKSRKKK